MLTYLSIHHLAVVEHLELSFQSGMTVLTGETGAGKSILIDALGLTLGERADNNIVRHNCPYAEISAIYELKELPIVSKWLAEQELEAEECIIRRTISQEGRSRAYINGRNVPLAQLRELGELLINIHGQHQHQSLLKPEYQRVMLDEYANHPDLINKVKSDYSILQHLRKEFKELVKLQGQSDKLALLQYQLREIEELHLHENELPMLEAEHKELAHADQWLTICGSALTALKGDSGEDAFSALHYSLNQITSLKSHTTKLNTCHELLTNALINLEEVIHELQSFKETLDLDPNRLNVVDARLSQIHALARKHRIAPETIPEHQKTLAKEIENLLNLQTSLDSLQEKLKAAETAYNQSAQQLSQGRRKAATLLEEQITNSLHTLEMPNGTFKIEFLNKDDTTPSSHGFDEIEFLVSTNPGLPLQALRKIASGGELSRISLAIQVITAQKMTTPTLIFDEVDAGISGKTAEIVGKLLRKLAKETQVFCVTHLPQVAAQGHQHYKVAKKQTAESTTTQIFLLKKEERIQELARMLGGATITQPALAHAEIMLETV